MSLSLGEECSFLITPSQVNNTSTGQNARRSSRLPEMAIQIKHSAMIATRMTITMTSTGPYSHSIVPGGFDVMSYTTRFTPGTSFTMRLAILARTS